MSAGAYANPAYNTDVINQYAQMYRVDPSQIQYVPGQGYTVAGQNSSFSPTDLSGQYATGGIPPTPLNPDYYLSNPATTQLSNLLGDPEAQYVSSPPGSAIQIPDANGLQMPDGSVEDAGVIANLFDAGYSPDALSQQLKQDSGGQINLTPQQIAQFEGVSNINASPANQTAPSSNISGPYELPTQSPSNPYTAVADPTSQMQVSDVNPYASQNLYAPYSDPTAQDQVASSTPITSQDSQIAGSTYQPPPGTYGGAGSTGVYQYSGANPFEPGGIAIPGGPIAPGPNTLFPNYSSYSPTNINTNADMAVDIPNAEYNLSLDYGNTFANQYGTEYTSDMDLQNAYQSQSDAAYSDLYNTPGYTTQQQSDILQQPLITGSMTTPDQLQSNYLTSPEQSAIEGNPSSVGAAFDPSTLNTIPQNMGTSLSGIYGDASTGYSDALSGAERGFGSIDSNLSGAFGGNIAQLQGTQGQIAGTQTSGFGADISNTAAALNSNLGTTANDIYGTAMFSNPSSLQLSDQWVNQANAAAGQNVALQYGAAQTQLENNARASGNVNPLAITAAQENLDRQSSIQQANAVNDAAVTNREAQLGAASNLAQEQVGAYTNLGEMGQQSAEYTGEEQMAATENEVALQQQQAQAMSGLEATASEEEAGLQTGQQEYQTGEQVATTQAQEQAQQAGAEYTGGEQLAAGEYAGSTAIGQAEYEDQVAAQRAQAVAQNRQATNQYNQQTTYQQGMEAASTLSGAYTNIANAQIQGQQAARNYWQGQSQYFGNQANQATQARLSGAQTSLSGMGQAGTTAAYTSAARSGKLNVGPISVPFVSGGL